MTACTTGRRRRCILSHSLGGFGQKRALLTILDITRPHTIQYAEDLLGKRETDLAGPNNSYRSCCCASSRHAACGGGGKSTKPSTTTTTIGPLTPAQVFDQTHAQTVEILGKQGDNNVGGSGGVIDVAKGLVLAAAHVAGTSALKVRFNDSPTSCRRTCSARTPARTSRSCK